MRFRAESTPWDNRVMRISRANVAPSFEAISRRVEFDPQSTTATLKGTDIDDLHLGYAHRLGHDDQRENDPLPHASHFATPLGRRPEGRTGPQYRASPPASSSSWVAQSGHSGRW